MRVGGLGAPELILIVVALVLVFGAGKLGDIGGALGKSVREFKRAQRDDEAAPEPETTGSVPETSAQEIPATAALTTAPPPAATAAPPAVIDYRPGTPRGTATR